MTLRQDVAEFFLKHFQGLMPGLTGDDDVLSIGLNRAVVVIAEAGTRGSRNGGRELGVHPGDAKKITVGALWRFGVSFMMFMGIVYFLKFDSLQTEIRTVLLIIVTAPPAVFNVVFADYFKLDEKFAAISVASMTLLSLALLPLLILFGMWAF